MQSVNHSISRDENLFIGNALRQQIFPAQRRRSKMICRNTTSDLSVHLFRPRTVNIMSPQTRLDMTDGNLTVKGGKRRRSRGSGVAVDKNQIRLRFLQDSAHPKQDTARHVVKILPRLHDVQVIIRRNFKEMQHLIQHLPVLTGYAYNCLKCIWMFPEFFHQRRHLDRLRARAEHKHYFFHLQTESL